MTSVTSAFLNHLRSLYPSQAGTGNGVGGGSFFPAPDPLDKVRLKNCLPVSSFQSLVYYLGGGVQCEQST